MADSLRSSSNMETSWCFTGRQCAGVLHRQLQGSAVPANVEPRTLNKGADYAKDQNREIFA